MSSLCIAIKNTLFLPEKIDLKMTVLEGLENLTK